MNFLDLLRKSLERYAKHHEQRDDEFAVLFDRNIKALSDRRTLMLHIILAGALNFFVWISVLIFPRDVADAWSRVSGLNDKITAVLIAILFGIGFWLTYALFRIKFPDLEDKRFDDEILASYHASEHSLKRYRVWLASTIGGVVNVLLLMIVESYLVTGL